MLGFLPGEPGFEILGPFSVASAANVARKRLGKEQRFKGYELDAMK